MKKPRLLDLFCGAIALLNRLWYNKVWLFNVHIVVSKLKPSARQRKYVRLGVSKDFGWAYPKREIVYFVVRFFNLEKVTIIGGIAHNLVLKEQLLRKPWLGINPTQKLWVSITRTAWLKTLICGETSTIKNGWKLYRYWVANV